MHCCPHRQKSDLSRQKAVKKVMNSSFSAADDQQIPSFIISKFPSHYQQNLNTYGRLFYRKKSELHISQILLRLLSEAIKNSLSLKQPNIQYSQLCNVFTQLFIAP